MTLFVSETTMTYVQQKEYTGDYYCFSIGIDKVSLQSTRTPTNTTNLNSR